MESKKSRGYIIPEAVDPEELVCISLYVPNDPLYIAAFGGAYERLGTWQVWEKDGTTRAAQAAQVWKRAIDKSRDELWIGACMNCCEELITAIENLSINVNVSGGCGCNVIKDYKFPDGWEDDTDTYPIRPPDSSDPPVVTGDPLCDMAHEAFQQMYEMIGGFAQALSEYEPYYSIAMFFNTIALVIPSVGEVYEAVGSWVLAQYGNLVSDSEDYLFSMKEKIICAIVEAPSAAQAKTDIMTIIQDEPGIPYEVRQWLLALYTGLALNSIYEGTLGNRPEFDNSDCSSCGFPDPIPNVEWRTGQLSQTLDDPKDSLQIFSHGYSYEILIGQNETWAADILMEPPTIAQNERIVATTWFIEERDALSVDGTIAVADSQTEGQWKILSYATGYAALQQTDNYDATYEHPLENVDDPFTIENRLVSGSGTIGIQEARLRVINILWAVETIQE